MADGERMRVTHVITGLQVGGAERLLAHLLAAIDGAELSHDVVVLGRDGPVGDQIRALGVPVWSLEAGRPLDAGLAVWRLTRHLRQRRPDLVHTWMVHANALGGLAARLAGRPVLWSLHHSDLHAGGIRHRTVALERLNALLSRALADAVVTTSAAASDLHVRRGYRRDRLIAIPNAAVAAAAGDADGAKLRRELGLPESRLLVGRVGRLAPQKDYETFFVAMGLLARRNPAVHVVAAGRGVDESSPEIVAWVSAAGLDGRCSLLGERVDADRLSASFEVAVSSSAFGETTPLVLMEALSAGTPVVTTDVGDCRHLVGPGGLVVTPRDPAGLARAVGALLCLPSEARRRIGDAGRRHVARRGGTNQLARDYEDAYRRVTALG